MVLKLDEFSHLSYWSFGLSFPIELEYIQFVLSLRVGV